MLLVALALWLGSGVVVLLVVWGVLLRERASGPVPTAQDAETLEEPADPQGASSAAASGRPLRAEEQASR